VTDAVKVLRHVTTESHWRRCGVALTTVSTIYMVSHQVNYGSSKQTATRRTRCLYSISTVHQMSDEGHVCVLRPRPPNRNWSQAPRATSIVRLRYRVNAPCPGAFTRYLSLSIDVLY